MRGRGIATGSTITGVSSPPSVRGGGGSEPAWSSSGLSVLELSCRLGSLSCCDFLLPLRIAGPFPCGCIFAISEIEDEELAALGDSTTTDFERSRFCFCRNLGSLDVPCGVDGGDAGDWDWDLEDIRKREREVVGVVMVVEEKVARCSLHSTTSDNARCGVPDRMVPKRGCRMYSLAPAGLRLRLSLGFYYRPYNIYVDRAKTFNPYWL